MDYQAQYNEETSSGCRLPLPLDKERGVEADVM